MKYRIDRGKLAAILARRDMTVLRLAELSGVSRATISGIRGGKTIAPDTAKKIAKALGVDVTEIMEQEDV